MVRSVVGALSEVGLGRRDATWVSELAQSCERRAGAPVLPAHGLTLASTTRGNLARAAVEGMLCGLAAGLDAVRAVGVHETRILIIGGAEQNPAVVVGDDAADADAAVARGFGCPARLLKNVLALRALFRRYS